MGSPNSGHEGGPRSNETRGGLKTGPSPDELDDGSVKPDMEEGKGGQPCIYVGVKPTGPSMATAVSIVESCQPIG